MKFQNPVLRGMYPDPSMCRYQDKYYMVCSTFQYFPGVPVFESTDMINWKQIGHCLTRPSQIALEKVNSSGGVFAPTIRCNEGRFYMVTTNDTYHQNFYVYTDDIYGEWSEPVVVEQDGIDPSLFFEDGKTYFISNGTGANGLGCIQMCEIDIQTGKKLSPSRELWQGTGGRFLESPHLYRFGEYYYLVEAEGGTEYGHMVNYARSHSIWGPYEPYPGNPVLTNRNLGGYQLQGAGHGDILEDAHGNWWFCHLAFRQIHRWLTFHHLGRETCMEPLYWQDDGWFVIGENATAPMEVSLPDHITFAPQTLSYKKTFKNLSPKLDWVYLRTPQWENYRFETDALCLAGTAITLNDIDSPTCALIRQTEFDLIIDCQISPQKQEAGITLYMDEQHHYEIAAREMGISGAVSVFVRQTIGCVSQESEKVTLPGDSVSIRIQAEAEQYHFYLLADEKELHLADANTRYLSSEVANGFTGVMIGLYAVNSGTEKIWSRFTGLSVRHEE
ncbi:MAG: glycoside hydrolase family 43 protein [Clostridiaceae bacterium]|nr:glycoside hydrolase family 43 protein [Clostridiaceae bacterium]